MSITNVLFKLIVIKLGSHLKFCNTDTISCLIDLFIEGVVKIFALLEDVLIFGNVVLYIGYTSTNKTSLFS